MIDDDHWDRACLQSPWLRDLDRGVQQRTRQLAARFLQDKAFSSAHGLELDDDSCVQIAIQACLPVNRLGLDWFGGFHEIIVHPGAFIVDREEVDENGVVHRWRDTLSGEVMPQGPVVLSWHDVRGRIPDGFQESPDEPHGSRSDVDASISGRLASAVVIHEFAHVLDMATGEADGVPPLRARSIDGAVIDIDRRQWIGALHEAFDAFCALVDEIESAIPDTMDPESDDALPYWNELPLDAYAATDEAEFFAVASEVYFTDPRKLDAAFPDLFALMKRVYG